jgi:hypothetical protein
MDRLFSNRRMPTRWRGWQARLWRLAQLGSDREGQDLVEYALLAGFVAVAAGACCQRSAPASAPSFRE